VRARGLLGRLRARAGEPATRALGRRGERAAARYLRKRGYRILERNVRSRLGEIDLLVTDPDDRTLVVVEVKTRAAPEGDVPDARDPGRPERNITAHKRRKLLALARDLARRRGWEGIPMRIDVVAVECPARGKPVIRHHAGAVRG
jgi:putative endonuclease